MAIVLKKKNAGPGAKGWIYAKYARPTKLVAKACPNYQSKEFDLSEKVQFVLLDCERRHTQGNKLSWVYTFATDKVPGKLLYATQQYFHIELPGPKDDYFLKQNEPKRSDAAAAIDIELPTPNKDSQFKNFNWTI